MSVWFTSDLHLGGANIIKFRGFDTIAEHDYTIVENINAKVNKRDKLYILGDFITGKSGIVWANNIACKNIEFIMGNHDELSIAQYLAIVQKIHGFKKYKGMWLSHCPIHPQELYRVNGNIHGHIHNGGATKQMEDPRYINVNVDMNDMMPVSFGSIQERVGKL